MSLIHDLPGMPSYPLIGTFSCEAQQQFDSFTGTATTDGGAARPDAFRGRVVMPAFQQDDDMGPITVTGSVLLPDGTSRYGFFMSEWTPTARTCAITDGVMRISINTRLNAAIGGVASNGDNVSGSATGFVTGYVEIAPDMSVISSAFTYRLLKFTDPARITITPAEVTHPIGTTHEMTFTVRDFGSTSDPTPRPVSGASVIFAVTGSASILSECTTNSEGECTVSYGGPRFPVTDHITAFADINGDGVTSFGEPSATSTVIWGDDERPLLSAPPDITVPATPNACTATISAGALGNATATDNSGSATIVGPAGGTFPLGTTSVLWKATDATGNEATATQSVTVIDQQSPTLTAPASIIVGNDPGLARASVPIAAPAAPDNCGSVTPIGIRSDGIALTEPYPVGTTTIVWTATDPSGNSSSAAQAVTVNDVERPVLTVPASLVVNATSPNGARVSYGESARDNVAVASLLCVPPSGSILAIGSTSVRCTARDDALNETTATFSVRVLGAAEQIVNLIEYVKGAVLPSIQRTQLVDFLQRALSDPRRTPYACSSLDLFIGVVRSKSGTVIPVDKAGRMIADAVRIKAVLACP